MNRDTKMDLTWMLIPIPAILALLIILLNLGSPKHLTENEIADQVKAPTVATESTQTGDKRLENIRRNLGNLSSKLKDKAINKIDEALERAVETVGETSVSEKDLEPISEVYNRKDFGGWADLDGDGCSTRNEILARDLTNVVLDSDGCTVLAGDLVDFYTGEKVRYIKTARNVEVDHIVPVKEAFKHGLNKADKAYKKVFYNDERNLVAVSKESNRAKSDKTMSEWINNIPSERQEEYVEKYCFISIEYSLNLEGC